MWIFFEGIFGIEIEMQDLPPNIEFDYNHNKQVHIIQFEIKIWCFLCHKAFDMQVGNSVTASEKIEAFASH